MNNSILLLAIVFFSPVAYGQPASHWNQFRGPEGTGISSSSDLPVEFDETTNIRWKTPIHASGWSSPIVWEDEIWVTSGDNERGELRAYCINLKNGRVVKDILVFDILVF